MKLFVLTRRDLFRLAGAAGVTYMAGGSIGAQSLTPAATAVDHLLLGAADLDKAIAWVEGLTGVRAVIGGSHPGVGTRNALLSLGGRRYLEIIAPDPAQTSFNSRHDIRKLTEPRLITWAAASKDLDVIAKRAAAGGLQIFGPSDGSRARPDGKLLEWKVLGIKHGLTSDVVDPIPFFIEWAPDSVHPSQDSPEGCELRALDIASPEPSRVADALQRLGVEASVEQGPSPRLTATLETPKGTVILK